MWFVFGRFLLGKILTDASVKGRVMTELRAQAAKTETKIDDQAVDVVSEVWDVIVPIVAGK